MADRHRVVALLAAEVVAFDLAIPAQIFGREPDLYDWAVCAPEAGPVATENGFDVLVPHGLDALAEADTIVVPGIGDRAWPLPPEPVEALRAAAAAGGARVASICTGAFVLAAAGLLDGRRATTHWRYAALLKREFPAVEVDPDVLYVDEGDVLTSAGVAAGIDLCLHMVRKDHGAGVANGIARRIVVAAHRDGGQAQFVERPLPAPDGGLAATRAWMEERLDQPLTVDDMARHAACSPRSFARRFRAETGTTPLQWLIGRRVAEAQRLLEGSELPVEQVASQSGFGTAAALRQHFGRALSTSPTAYRRAFRPQPARS